MTYLQHVISILHQKILYGLSWFLRKSLHCYHHRNKNFAASQENLSLGDQKFRKFFDSEFPRTIEPKGTTLVISIQLHGNDTVLSIVSCHCPEYTFLTYWLARSLLKNLGFEANLTLADHSQTVWDFTGAPPWWRRFQALSYQFGSSAKLLTSLTA